VRACSQAAELGNTDTELQACRQLHNLAKQGTNTGIYRAVCAQVPLSRSILSRVQPELGTRLTVRPAQIGDRLGAEHKLDTAWIAKTDSVSVPPAAFCPSARVLIDGSGVLSTGQAWKVQFERMEQDLQVSKTNSMKDGIRMGCNDIGEHYERRGDLGAALKSFLRNRDYSHPAKYELEFVLNVLRVKINIPHLHQIESFAIKGEKNQLLEQKASDAPAVTKTKKALAARMKVCCGLAHLHGKKYKSAARKFVAAEPELQYATAQPFADWVKHVISPRDVAVYGGLCALAEFDRSELKQFVIDEGCSFRQYLELCPDVREIVGDFYCSRYPSCLKTLTKLSGELAYDIHLSSHLSLLQEKIRSRALIQYTSAYLKLDLVLMAKAFNTDLVSLEAEVAKLITSGAVAMRIDSDKKHLVAKKEALRAMTFDKSMDAGKEAVNVGKLLMLRTNLQRSKFLVKPAGGNGKGVAMAAAGAAGFAAGVVDLSDHPGSPSVSAAAAATQPPQTSDRQTGDAQTATDMEMAD
jgi:COP9 signalosome complex subunit 1